MSGKAQRSGRSRGPAQGGEPASRGSILERTLLPLSPGFIFAVALLAAGVSPAAEKPGDPLAPALSRLQEEIRAGCSCESLRVEWRLGEGVRAAAAGLDSLRALLIPPPVGAEGTQVPDHVQIRLLGRQDGRPVEILGSGEVRCFGQAWLPRRALSRGAALDGAVLTQETGWYPPAAFSVGEALLASSVARRPLERGRPLTEEDLMPPPCIRRGARLSIVYQTPGMTVEGVGQARADAWMGDRIQVRVTGAARDCQGIVTGPNRVEIQPGGGNG
jgi:flagella basal body P-ring formation protein FlgA